MFVVNGKMLSKKEQPELFAWYQKKLDEIRKYPSDYYIFSSSKTSQYEVDDHGRKRKIKRYKAIPPSSTIFNDEFSESQTWNYVVSANSVRNENGMLSIVNQHPFAIGARYNLHKENDIEIVFFLVYISEAVKNKHIFIIDKHRDNIEQAERSKIAAEAQFLLYHDTSPISPESVGSEDAIRQIAMSFGVLGVIDKHLAEVRNSLWDRIMDKEKTRDKGLFGFEGFLNAVSKIKDSAKRAVILTAVELGFLYYEDLKWHLQIKGVETRELCNVPPNDEGEKKEYLIDYVLKNIEYFNLISTAVREPEKSKIRDDTDKLEREQLIDEAARLGWERTVLYKKKTKELEEIVANVIQPKEPEIKE